MAFGTVCILALLAEAFARDRALRSGDYGDSGARTVGSRTTYALDSPTTCSATTKRGSAKLPRFLRLEADQPPNKAFTSVAALLNSDRWILKSKPDVPPWNGMLFPVNRAAVPPPHVWPRYCQPLLAPA